MNMDCCPFERLRDDVVSFSVVRVVQNGGVGAVALSLAHLMILMHCEFKCDSLSFPTLMIVCNYCTFCPINIISYNII